MGVGLLTDEGECGWQADKWGDCARRERIDDEDAELCYVQEREVERVRCRA
jgi:hypothetical protein